MAVGNNDHKPSVVIIGGGFTGLTAAYEVAGEGIPVILLEKENEVGGLAGSFRIGKQRLEKFYHHWFNKEEHVIHLIKELGLESELLYSLTKTGIYLENRFFKLCTPLDVLRFKPLSLVNRIRLGLLALKVRLVKEWKELDIMTAQEWLLKICGRDVYRIVWEPLLRGKFGPFASEISAAWFWNKLLLRARSRNNVGKEVLVYYRNGFSALVDEIVNKVESAGGIIHTGVAAESLVVQDGIVKGVQTPNGTINAQAVIATPALPIIADLLKPHVSSKYIAELRRVKYLANACLVLELSHSLSDIYWLNINDPDFPYVGVIEHTNFQPAETYGGRHIIYLSKYLPETAELYRMNEEQVFEFSLPHINRIFPKFDRSWVHSYHLWKAPYAQPIVQRNYSHLIPANETPIKGLYIATMAQIYSEDRGTNYAIREGRRVGRIVAKQMASEGLTETTSGSTSPKEIV